MNISLFQPVDLEPDQLSPSKPFDEEDFKEKSNEEKMEKEMKNDVSNDEKN